MQPSVESMTWLAEQFRLESDVVHGLYLLLIGDPAVDPTPIINCTKEVLRRCRIDEENEDEYLDFIGLLISMDEEELREFHTSLGF
jgi:hypothetical protein